MCSTKYSNICSIIGWFKEKITSNVGETCTFSSSLPEQNLIQPFSSSILGCKIKMLTVILKHATSRKVL